MQQSTRPSGLQPSVEQKRSALEAALASETFARSEQLRSLLRFLCEAEIEGRGAEITEYQIGVRALSRPEGFSPLEDSTVRTRTYELRQRLQRLYSTEAPELPVQIRLPKGTYAPHFECIQDDAAVPPPARRRPRLLAPALAFAAGALAAGLAVWLGPARRPPVDPLLQQAWTSLLKPGGEVQLCVATPLHMLVSPYMSALPAGAVKFDAPEGSAALFSRFRPLPPGGKLEMQPVQKAVALGSVQALVRAASTLEKLGAPFRIIHETNAPLVAMRQRPLVMLGSSWYSRTVSTLLEDAHWNMKQDPASREVAIIGKDGSRYLPKRGPNGEYQEVFGLISVLPNGGAHRAYVLSGLTSVGTHAAALFLSDPASLSLLQSEFRKAGSSAWPAAFQVVVRCRASEDAQLLNHRFEALQVLH